MIVITTPTGQIGSQLVTAVLDANTTARLRLIARDPSRLEPTVRDRVQVIVGSHDDPAVLDEALDGAEALFWLVPPNMRATSSEQHYLSFARPAAAAIARHQVGHVVGVSSAGRGWPHPAGLLSAAFAMDAELERAGAAYRSLAMPFYMENLIHQLPRMTSQGVFSLPFSPGRLLPTIATRDIAEAATRLLLDLSWEGAERVLVFGPDRLTPTTMAETISDALAAQVSYERADLEQLIAAMAERGASQGTARDFAEMYRAQEDGIYDQDWSNASPAQTSFATWCQTVLGPAARERQPDRV
jgi:uncharacterized protein YbjT (DUF2867 family)